jgi:hypothetical protein
VSALLKGLSPAVRAAVSERAFRTGEVVAVDARPYVIEDIGLGRAIELAPLRAVVDWAMRRRRPGESDAWLAPRVHATLRLTRREAADRRIWAFLAAVALPDYVRWRWRDLDDRRAPVAIDRFVGGAAANAVSQLWWAAELTRDGADYRPTVAALTGPGFSPAWLDLGLLHHRAAAQAVVAYLAEIGDSAAAGDRGRAVVRALDVALRAIALDALAPAPPPDAEAVREWCSTPVDETLFIRRLPVGPDELPVSRSDVAAVRAILDQLVEQTGPRRAGSGRSRCARATRQATGTRRPTATATRPNSSP